MIRIVKNISVHLWITTLFAIPLSFYVLPGLSIHFPEINPFVAAFLTLTGIAAIISFLMGLTTIKIINGLLKKGQAWERSGTLKKAQKNYIKILRLYDTCLLWPFSAKKTARRILSTIAKFDLNYFQSNFVKKNPHFKISVLIYLKMNPEDKDIAQLWLIRLRQSSIITSFDQEILSILAEKYYNDKKLSVLILDIFLGLERKDFTAKKLYQHILQNSELKKQYAKKIESLIGNSEDGLQQRVSFNLPNGKMSTDADKTVSKKKSVQIGTRTNLIASKIIFCIKSLWTFTNYILSLQALSAKKIYTFIKKHEKTRMYLKASAFLIVLAGLLFFMMNTVFHIFKPKTIDKKKIYVPIQVAKPLTIQVAAYLNLKHARQYVEILKKKKIDAIMKKVNGGGKTWFVVQVSEFTDKKSAAAYGQKLKKKKIIDDFFVNNK